MRGEKRYGAGDEPELPAEDPRRDLLIRWLAERDGFHTVCSGTYFYLGVEVDQLLEKLDELT